MYNVYFVIGCIIIGICWVIVTLIRTTVNSRTKKGELKAQSAMIESLMAKIAEFYEKMIEAM